MLLPQLEFGLDSQSETILGAFVTRGQKHCGVMDTAWIQEADTPDCATEMKFGLDNNMSTVC